MLSEQINPLERLIDALTHTARNEGLDAGVMEVNLTPNEPKPAGRGQVRMLQLRPRQEEVQETQPSLGLLRVRAGRHGALLPLLEKPEPDSRPLQFELTAEEKDWLETMAQRGVISLDYLESLKVLQREGASWRFSQMVVEGEIVGADAVWVAEKKYPRKLIPLVRVVSRKTGARMQACWLHRIPESKWYLPVLRSGWLLAARLEDPFDPEDRQG